jgi:hypothetical protein
MLQKLKTNKIRNMKKLLLILTISLTLTGCKSCVANYEQRKAGIQKVCPKCIYTVSENMNIAQDTSTNPNIIYKVYFCSGGIYYNAWEVDHLTKLQ